MCDLCILSAWPFAADRHRSQAAEGPGPNSDYASRAVDSGMLRYPKIFLLFFSLSFCKSCSENGYTVDTSESLFTFLLFLPLTFPLRLATHSLVKPSCSSDSERGKHPIPSRYIVLWQLAYPFVIPT